jgi:release factor glutamine methyltransferase
MRKIIKRIATAFFVPLTLWYLRKERTYDYRGTIISVLPGVFHPGFFSSTKFVLDYLEHQDLNKKKLLEIGSGTGLISIRAAKANALVTALDLSTIAVRNTTINATRNGAPVNILHSDLLTSLKKDTFDWIIINPPYYAREPKKESDLAWFCGEHFEYFRKLFDQLPPFMHSGSHVIIVLTKGCDLKKIFSLAREAGFNFELLREKKVFFDEKDFLYRLTSKASVAAEA